MPDGLDDYNYTLNIIRFLRNGDSVSDAYEYSHYCRIGIDDYFCRIYRGVVPLSGINSVG
jgi:hypothetical protein